MSRRYQAAILTASYNGLQVPNAPTIGTATAGAGSASVTFTAPSNVGGSAITSYTVISSPGSILGTGSSSPITVSGLTNGTAYTFTVVATNAYGSGPASAASNSVTPVANYIEAVFSTYLYTGNGSTQTITNGIDLSGKGGMVWAKNRTSIQSHEIADTVRGYDKSLRPNATIAEFLGDFGGFTSTGFSLIYANSGNTNESGKNYTSWTFREQAKFFDVVTWSGNNTYGRTISHNLGSVPGCIIIKCTSVGATNWCVYHRGLTTPTDQGLYLNATDAAGDVAFWAYTAPTSTVFSLSASDQVNATGSTYVAYLFAHNAGGFGESSTDNVISCGSTSVTAGGDATVTLGYEPQWVLLKRTDAAGGWAIFDNMRGWAFTGTALLNPNSTSAESNYGATPVGNPTATGFTLQNFTSASGSTYIYVAIRRGPMAVPTVGTSVFNPVYGQSGAPAFRSANFNAGIDTAFYFYPAGYNDGTNAYPNLQNRLIGLNQLQTPNTRTELSLNYNKWDYMNGVTNLTSLDTSFGSWMFKRASGFHDVVCYTGTGATPQNITHNLGVAPELIIVKVRNEVDWSWIVYSGNAGQYLLLDTVDPVTSNANVWNNTAPTSSVFSVGNAGNSNLSGKNLVAYLFATAAGVSKVGSYTGTGALQTIACGFTTGARFILIKRTDSTGDWYVWDSARGITAGNDPYLTLNTYNAEVTGTNYVDTTAAGFQVTAAAPAGLNAVGGTYIFLAIA